jgi:response regulator of citrate/malate metabolism
VERVTGFICVGQAHTAAEARAAIEREKPDLLILDIYLPDQDGLSLLRSLAATGTAPDTIFITAARDVETVRAAMGLGAIYYLVKPFRLPQFREQLDAYRRWREQLHAETGEANQATIYALFSTLHPPAPNAAGRPDLTPTMTKILHVVQTAPQPIGAAAIAETLGMSRPTAQRYLTELHRKGLIELELSYGATGRPVHRYRRPHPSPPVSERLRCRETRGRSSAQDDR